MGTARNKVTRRKRISHHPNKNKSKKRKSKGQKKTKADDESDSDDEKLRTKKKSRKSGADELDEDGFKKWSDDEGDWSDVDDGKSFLSSQSLHLY